jgi:hypothetical protein
MREAEREPRERESHSEDVHEVLSVQVRERSPHVGAREVERCDELVEIEPASTLLRVGHQSENERCDDSAGDRDFHGVASPLAVAGWMPTGQAARNDRILGFPRAHAERTY